MVRRRAKKQPRPPREATRAEILCFMAGLAHAARDARLFEAQMLELLAHVTFAEEVTR